MGAQSASRTGHRAPGSPAGDWDHAPGGASAGLGIVLCVAGHALSGYGTFVGGARGSRYSLAGDIVSIVMSLWSVANTWDALLSMADD